MTLTYHNPNYSIALFDKCFFLVRISSCHISRVDSSLQRKVFFSVIFLYGNYFPLSDNAIGKF